MSRPSLSDLIAAAELELPVAERLLTEAAAAEESVLARLAADELVGAASAGDVARVRELTAGRTAVARERVKSLRRALPELRTRLAEEQERERARDLGRARESLRQAAGSRDRAAKNVLRAVRAAVSAGDELERHRELTEAAIEKVNVLRAGGEDVGVDLDEPDFAVGAERLRALLAAGARRPSVKARERALEAKAVRARQDNEKLVWFRRYASERALAQLEPHLHKRARMILQQADAEHEAARERIQAAQAERTYERV